MAEPLSSTNLTQTDLTQCIRLGAIGRAHGLKGAFFLSSAQAREPWQKHKNVWLKTRSGMTQAQVLSHYISAGQTVLLLDCASDRTQIESLVGTEIYVERKNIKKQKGEFLVSELIGLRVTSAEHENLGIVKAVHDFGAQPNFEIELVGTNETVFFPFLEHLVKRIDLQEKLLEVVYVPEFFEDSK